MLIFTLRIGSRRAFDGAGHERARFLARSITAADLKSTMACSARDVVECPKAPQKSRPENSFCATHFSRPPPHQLRRAFAGAPTKMH
jgi:hypothetical protein